MPSRIPVMGRDVRQTRPPKHAVPRILDNNLCVGNGWCWPDAAKQSMGMMIWSTQDQIKANYLYTQRHSFEIGRAHV